MNHMVNNLSEIIKKNIQTSRYLTSSAFDQQASLEQTSTLLEKMSRSTKKNVESANKADEFMAETTGVVNRANDIMDSLTDSMNEISKASEESYQIIKTIDEIAFQTNLLSLNAAVEAARAGNAGLEFAVVAGEVKKLAMRSAEAARNTATLIEDTVKKINDGEKLVLRANEGFQEVADYAAKVAELVSEISLSSDEQNKKIDQINEAIARMNIVTERNVASAKALASSMSIFKVSGRKMLA
jgi:methyl-accepting chemotaxis protein